MPNSRPLCLAAVLILAAGPLASLAQESKLSALLSKSPKQPNSMMYVHVPSLSKLMTDAEMESPLADQLQEVWLVSHLDTVVMQPQWEAGYATLSQTPDLDSLASLVGGYVDAIDDKKFVWTPTQSYLTAVKNGLGFLRPANRQLLAAWARGDSNSAPSEFLKSQAVQPEQYLSLMLAYDMKDAFSPVVLRQKLDAFESLKSTDLDQAAKVLSSVQGFTIIVGRRSLQECKMSVAFGESPSALQAVAPALLNEILNRNGTGAAEVASWKASVNGNTLTLQGGISEDSLDGILGIFTLQSQAQQLTDVASRKDEAGGAAREPLPREGQAYATKNYFDRVNKLIERTRKYDAQTTGYRAKWNDQNARRIDELNTLGVDPVVVEYGANVSAMLRGNAAAIRGANVQAGQQQAAQGLSGGYYGYRGTYSGYYGGSYGGASGYYDPNSTTDYQRVIGSQTRMAGFNSWRQTLSQIEKMTGDVRREMTQKYGTAF